jgi:hypothetical protein
MKIRLSSLLACAVFSAVFAIGMFVPSSMATTSLIENAASVEVGACGKCGDGYCNKRCGETALSCPKDCGVSSESYQSFVERLN